MAGPSVFTGEEVQGYEDDVYVFIDRGYLRLAGNDSECLDHGEKVKINFCPLCGEWLTNPEKEDKS